MVQVIIEKRDRTGFLRDCLMLSLCCKKNTDAKAFVSLCTRHWPRWRFGALLPVSKATHQTILGSLIFVWIQEQGRCLAQMQAQAFSQCLYLEPREEQTNCVIGEVISWPQALWPGSGIMATDVVAGKWYHGHRCCGREVVSWPQKLWPWCHFPNYTICSSPTAVCSDSLVILSVKWCMMYFHL